MTGLHRNGVFSTCPFNGIEKISIKTHPRLIYGIQNRVNPGRKNLL